jgi:hypothetical protein
MRRILRFFVRPQPPPPPWAMSPDLRRQLLSHLSEIGLGIVEEARGPVPLMTFGRRVLERLESIHPPIPLHHFADALKRVIHDMEHDRLRVMSPTDFAGVGYVYNARDPETYPVRSGCR